MIIKISKDRGEEDWGWSFYGKFYLYGLLTGNNKQGELALLCKCWDHWFELQYPRRVCSDGVHRVALSDTGTQVNRLKTNIHLPTPQNQHDKLKFYRMGRFVKLWHSLFSCLLTVCATGFGIGWSASILSWRGSRNCGKRRLTVKPCQKREWGGNAYVSWEVNLLYADSLKSQNNKQMRMGRNKKLSAGKTSMETGEPKLSNQVVSWPGI